MSADAGLHDAASLRVLNAGFEECEQIIERGLATFVEVGSALVRIRDGRLYRQEYATFEVYCAQRWGFTDRRARQLMAAAEIGTVVPVSTESQARELTGLTSEQAERVYEQAAEVKPEPTAADLRAARQQLHPRPPTPVPATPPAGTGQTSSAVQSQPAEERPAPTATGAGSGPSVGHLPLVEHPDYRDHPVVAARASVARQPAMLAGKAVERLHTARLLLLEAGSATQIVADLANDGLTDGDQGHDWLPELDALLPLLTDLTAALRRRNLRSVNQ